jgi:hypothetical protein
VRALLVAVLILAASPAAADAPDYADDAKLFYRVVACAGDDPVPAKWKKVMKIMMMRN